MLRHLFALTPLALCGMCFAQQADKPSIKVGQVSVYVLEERADKRTSEDTQTVTAIDGDLLKIKSVNPGRTPTERFAVMTSELNTVVSTSSGARMDPHSALFSFPLTVGKSWPVTYGITTETGVKLKTETTSKVLGIEKVTVPAGEFEAYKVEQIGWSNGVSFSGGRRVSQVTWYAPSIGRVVRLEYKDWQSGALPRVHNVIELKSFSNAP